MGIFSDRAVHYDRIFVFLHMILNNVLCVNGGKIWQIIWQTIVSMRPIFSMRPIVVMLLGGDKVQPLFSRSRVSACFAFAAIFILSAGADSVRAQENSLENSLVENPIAQADNAQPMLIQADNLIYDNKRNTVSARGNVEIYYNDHTLLADRVLYDQKRKKLIAEGNVRIKEPDGALVKADHIELTEDFRQGFIGALQIITKEEVRIGAARAVRKDGNITVFDSGVFTPCKVCKDHPEKPPTWRIKAAKIIHDKNAKEITYNDATFDLFGTSIAYFPYFKHPDPTVKRKSGFLIPRLIFSEKLGSGIEVPYFFNLAPNYDFTFNPLFTTKKGALLKGQWRHRLANGVYDIKLAGINETEIDSESPTDNRFRGSVQTSGNFKLSSFWRYGWDVTFESDDTFRRVYKLDNIKREDRVSKLYLTGQSERNYFGANIYHFGGLLANDTTDSESIAHPVIDYNYIFAEPVLGGELSFNGNVVSLSRDDVNGVDSNRLTAELQWRRKFVDSLGQVFIPFGSVRGDLYDVANYSNPLTNEITSDDVITRGTAVAGLEYRFPFAAQSRNGSHIIEPIAQILVRPEVNNQDDVPNEDARSLVFDDTLLFDTDKFSGYDRLETGIRANVGLQYTGQLHNGGYIRAIFGQSYHIDGENQFAIGQNNNFARGGLANSESDYVTGVYFEPNSRLSFIAQSRFDDDDFALNRQDLLARVNLGIVSGQVNYAFSRDTATIGNRGTRADEEEILAAANLKISNYWSLFGGIRYDLEENFRVSDYVGLRYSDDCFTLSVSYNESFIDDRDADPDQSLTLFITLKQLGSFGLTNQSLFDDTAESSTSLF